MAEGLKPCPFCGRVDTLEILATETPFDDHRLTNWRVSCDRYTGCGGSGGAYRDRKEAIEAWNRRANDEQGAAGGADHANTAGN